MTNETRLDASNGGVAQTNYSYDATIGSNKLTITSDINSFGDNALQRSTVYDGLGRVVENRLYESASQYIATQTRYDARQRTAKVSNPFRPTLGETAQFTITDYDGLSRVTGVAYPDGSQDAMTYTGNQTAATDPAGVRRTTQSDAGGRLTSVAEYPAASPALVTSYGYDGLDDLTSVTQPGLTSSCPSGQSRCFTYDSLRRLVSATNPETGTSGYTYDPNGNMIAKTDARGTIACFGVLTGTSCDGSGYDKLNRRILKQYSDGTPAITWVWDTAQIGKLSSVSSAYSTTAFSNYDALGRPRATSQATPAGSAPLAFTYRYAPIGLSQMTYPSNRTVVYSYDPAGRIQSVGGAKTYASAVQYASHGSPESMQLGNLLYEQACFNNRLQTTGIRVGPGLTDSTLCSVSGDLLNLQFGYTAGSNNGSVSSQTINAGGPTFNQSYQYTDGLNRLTAFNETNGWTQTYNYDAFGNRAVTAGNIPRPDWTPTALTSFSQNKWIRGVGDHYDNSGNQLTVASSTSPNTAASTFVFDAENRITSANVGNMGATTYQYDGEGRRVVKSSANGTITYVYDASGQLAAEYSSVGSSASGTQYLTSDHLGSTRIVTDQSKNVTARYDYLPFGEEIPRGTNGRDSTYPAALYPAQPDIVSEKFTGKERDGETGLDYFGARYYASSMGRWMSPDWSAKQEPIPYSSLDNPQSLNLYDYVLNNPLSKADPDGHAGCPPDCSTGNNLVDFFLGAANAFSSDNLLGGGRVNQTSAGGQLGARLGDATALVTGTVEVGLGALGEVGGLALDATGVGAVVGVPANVVSAGVIAHGATIDTVAGANLMFSKRTGDFTKGEKNAMDSKNAADNGGVNKCTNCGQEVQKVQNKAGEPTPGNQLQRHHDPPLSQRPPGTKSPNDRILCKDCHVQEHQN